MCLGLGQELEVCRAGGRDFINAFTVPTMRQMCLMHLLSAPSSCLEYPCVAGLATDLKRKANQGDPTGVSLGTIEPLNQC